MIVRSPKKHFQHASRCAPRKIIRARRVVRIWRREGTAASWDQLDCSRLPSLSARWIAVIGRQKFQYLLLFQAVDRTRRRRSDRFMRRAGRCPPMSPAIAARQSSAHCVPEQCRTPSANTGTKDGDVRSAPACESVQFMVPSALTSL